MKTLRQRVKELEKANEKQRQQIKWLWDWCDSLEIKAGQKTLAMEKAEMLEERIEILEIIQKENQRDVLNLLAERKNK